MVVTLVPRFRTRPLAIRYQPDNVGGVAAGAAGCSGMAPTRGFGRFIKNP
jgi:hypothetical protein